MNVNWTGLIFSALLGLGLLVVVVLLARRSMLKEMAKKEKEEQKTNKAGESEMRGMPGGPNQG